MSEDLQLPPEPMALKRRLRESALDDPARWHAHDRGAGLARALWLEWGETIAAWGIEEPLFNGIVADYHHEVWLWLVGERTWSHAVGGLAGRVGRRLPERPNGAVGFVGAAAPGATTAGRRREPDPGEPT